MGVHMYTGKIKFQVLVTVLLLTFSICFAEHDYNEFYKGIKSELTKLTRNIYVKMRINRCVNGYYNDNNVKTLMDEDQLKTFNFASIHVVLKDKLLDVIIVDKKTNLIIYEDLSNTAFVDKEIFEYGNIFDYFTVSIE